jgi:hypothetical protein
LSFVGFLLAGRWCISGSHLGCAGIRETVFAAQAVWFFGSLRWHPRNAFVLQALPLCGAAPTFLCRRKEK